MNFALEQRSRRPAVLIVDDDPDITTVLHDLLEHDGYQVTEAGTCEEALHCTKTTAYDAILLDIGLPDGDGLSVLTQLHHANPLLPVIMLSATLSQRQPHASLGQGAFSCLPKPYDQEELRLVVRSAVDSARSPSSKSQALSPS